MTSANRLAVLGCAALVATTAAGCASATKAVTGGDSKSSAITMGTVNVTNVLDPAGAYDAGSWLLLNNTFQSLLRFPSGATVPQPDAAQSCAFAGSDATTYQCTVRSGLKFSNGHPLTAEDVVFSIQRMQKINDPSGPSSLLSTIKSVEAKGADVVFHLSTPDAVLPAKLASAAGAIVDHQVFPADKLLDNDKLVGSGPYKIDSIEPMAGGDGHAPGKVTLSANSQYQGEDKLQNNKFVLRYFDKAEDLKAALDKGDIDLADNSLEPPTAAKLKDDQLTGKSDFKVAEGESAEVRFLVFNTKDAVTGNPAVRQAIAQLLDRKVLARDVYARTVQPLYSVVPAGIAGHNTAFFDRYVEPDAGKAKKILNGARVSLPVKLNLTWSRARAGAAEMNEIKKQLEASGLFQVTVQQEPDWKAFQKGWKAGSYQAYTVGWTPDYADADDFITPLVVDGGAFHNGWDDPKISQKLVPESIKQTDRTAGGAYGQIQSIVADAVPVLPLFQNKSFYASRADITGVDSTVDTSGVFRFWEIGRTKK
ncbi:ABC transporter substrate-binding protein [Kitasatospora atroaurantiaca]|uniref:Peptide/nickel transport system substrate-binding protein n=1 Tax=Kitasatospora atroaurantiaca TaxID=285545 RepID=A0A561EYY3_9ACTN|nr:ABC transporter substrate-binding protein [Kitasatospora atroaurantiaca]TWE20816.1 peptide/nickel transport system substrate-binding protein [Kitasatospora atroaurantiaca]